jgi:ADP-L-glycero-D-manno-heptose 6-epimerase
MQHQIIVTGAAGFIASNLVRKLNLLGLNNLVLVDRFDNPLKEENLKGCSYTHKIDRDVFFEWFPEHAYEVGFVFHLGARTDTSEFNFRVLDSLNLSYSKFVWEICTAKNIPLVYASSAATYGMGENGFNDDHSLIKSLKPLNPYGLSKHLFDLFVLEQKNLPPFYAGLKFFNVYGPHESHKGRMASVVFHAYNQIKETGKLKLFQSHHTDFKDGEQLRDFIHVDDVVSILLYFFKRVIDSEKNPATENGIYNVGTGKAETFNALAQAVFDAMKLPQAIDYVPTPVDIRDKYQYYTEANIEKLLQGGYNKKFIDLREGIEKYVSYLRKIEF